jgi:hypothetical protein
MQFNLANRIEDRKVSANCHFILVNRRTVIHNYVGIIYSIEDYFKLEKRRDEKYLLYKLLSAYYHFII